MQLRDAVRARRGELDELEAVGRQRVVLDVMVHCKVLLNFPRVRESDEFARQAASCPPRGGTASSPAYSRPAASVGCTRRSSTNADKSRVISRSEERRVGKEWVSACRYRCAP